RYQIASEMRTDLRRLKRDSESGRSLSKEITGGQFAQDSQKHGGQSEANSTLKWFKRNWVLLTATIIVLLAACGALLWITKPAPAARGQLKQRQLTNSSFEEPVKNGAISPDGKYLAYSTGKRIYIKLVDTGDIQAVPQPSLPSGSEVYW